MQLKQIEQDILFQRHIFSAVVILLKPGERLDNKKEITFLIGRFIVTIYR